MTSPGSKHILVIDHNPAARNFICGFLEQRTLVCEQAASIEEALALLKDREFDLVLLDLMLPDRGGFKALEIMNRSFPAYHNRIVLMSSGEKRFLDRLPFNGWCAILTKPFQIAELWRTVELCLGERPAADMTN